MAASVVALTLLVPVVAAGAQDPSKAPQTQLSNGGRSVSDGVRQLNVSQASDLDPAGQRISVSGAGFDTAKPLYVAFCLLPPVNQKPTPCGGGNPTQTGDASASIRVSAEGQTGPGELGFQPDGSFEGTLDIGPMINEIDCRQARCAVVTRFDHARGEDRSADLFVPVTFGAPRTATTATTQPGAAPTVPTTLPVLQPDQVAPTATVSADGASVTDGTRTLRASEVEALDPDRATVRVEGSGFDAAKGVFVSLCAVPEADPALAVGAATKPAPCAGGSAAVSHWVSSNPPDYGKDLAVPYGDGGSFDAEITLAAVIDADHDCREVECAIVVRNDDVNAADRTQDLYLPVTFAAASSVADDEPEGEATVTESDDGGSSAGLLLAGLGGVVIVAGLVGAVVSRKRRGAADAEPPIEVSS